jgi:hypothetical protein
MAEEHSQYDFEIARLHQQDIRNIERDLLLTANGDSFLFVNSKANRDRVLKLASEKAVNISHHAWEILYSSNCIFSSQEVVEAIAKNPNPSIPVEVFVKLATNPISLDHQDFNEDIFKALCKSKNPNCNQTVIKALCVYVSDYNASIVGRSTTKNKIARNSIDLDELLHFVTVFDLLISATNQFATWKDELGNHLFLQFLDQDFLNSLESKTSRKKVEEILIVLSKNATIHSPDLVARLVELSKKFKNIEQYLYDSGNTSVCLKYDTKRSAITKQQQFLRATNYISVNFEGSQSWAYFTIEKNKITSRVFGETESSSKIAIRRQEIFNLADTFKNLLKALKYYQTQTNISALRLKLQDNSFENLIDISKETSTTRLLVDIASYIEKLSWFQKNATHKGLIQDFEDFVKNFRFDLIENAGTDGRAYQIVYVQKNHIPVNETNIDEVLNDIIGNDKVSFDFKEVYHLGNKIIQSHIQEGQNPKELVDGLVQIQTILKQLKAKVTEIPIVELTPEQIEDKQFLDEGYQEIESLFQVFPDLTARELFVKLCPGEEVPDKVEEFEWLLGYIEKERLSQMDKNITQVAEANLVEYKALSKVLNSIFAPDQSVEFTLNEGNYCDNLKQLWKRVQDIQAVYNGLKSDKNGLDQSEKRYSIFYKKFSRILLEELIKAYQEIAYISPNEKLGRIANDKVQVIGNYLNFRKQDSLVILDS